MVWGIFTRMWRIPFRSSLRQALADFRQCRLDRPRLGIQRRSCQRARQRHRYPERGALEADARPQIWRLPGARDDHLLRLTESTGMLQHATFAIPNYRHGYCMDDNQDCWASDEGIWLPYADDSKEPPGSDWKTCFIEAAGLGSAVGSYSINHNGM